MKNKIYRIIQQSELNVSWLRGLQTNGLPSLLIAIAVIIYIVWKL